MNNFERKIKRNLLNAKREQLKQSLFNLNTTGYMIYNGKSQFNTWENKQSNIINNQLRKLKNQVKRINQKLK